MYTMYETETHIDPDRILPSKCSALRKCPFHRYKPFQTDKYVQWKGCLVPPKSFLRALIADVQAAIRFIKDVQHSGGILQPRAKKKKQPPASEWDFDGKTFLKWWIGGVECTGEATGDCC